MVRPTATDRIHVGDRMRFDVLGRIITARVTSIRRVDWQDFRAGGFMFVFRPGPFDGAPHTFISSLQAPRDPAARGTHAGRRWSRSFPNVSVIDLREILQTIQGIVNNVTLAVTVVGGLVLLSGALILVGAVSMTKFRRVYEAAILKTLGASGRLIATMLLLEYGVLGAIAGTVGALGAIALSWAVARFALELPWEPTPLHHRRRHPGDRDVRRRPSACCPASTCCGTSRWPPCAPSKPDGGPATSGGRACVLRSAFGAVFAGRHSGPQGE